MMRAVAHMEPQPLLQGEIAERGMLHEQIVPASRQELVRQRDKACHAVPQLPLHRARIGTLGRLRCRRGTTARGNPPDIEIHELAEPLSQGPRPASHGGLGAPVLEHPTAPVDRDSEVVDDLSRAPFPGRSAVPVRLGPARQGPEHHVGNRGERFGGHRNAASAICLACAAAGDPARTRLTRVPALSTIARSASARAALSVRIERAHWRRAATACSRPISRSAAFGGRYTVTIVPASAGRGLARGAGLQANATPAIPHASRRATVASGTLIPKIVRVNLLRRYPIALTLIALLLLAALGPSPPLVDAVTGAPPADVDLVRPTLYTLLAPVSNVLDALTFLSLERAKAFLVTWVAALALVGFVQHGSLRRRLGAAVLAPLAVVLLGVAAVLLPRPVPSLVAADSTLTVIDYHAHTELSHDGRRGWTVADLAAWHAAQGFGASYVTDHNVVFNGGVDTLIRLLPGVEWSVYDQHIVALGTMAGG